MKANPFSERLIWTDYQNPISQSERWGFVCSRLNQLSLFEKVLMIKKLQLFGVFLFILLLGNYALAEVNLTELVKKVQPSVVTIITYDYNKEVLRQGSGFLIDEDGHIITNYHVLEGAGSAEVKTYDGNTYPVTIVVGENESKDLIKILMGVPESSFQWLEVSQVMPEVAERVVVVGSPMGLNRQ
jgi:S1-C subfamily serine protease